MKISEKESIYHINYKILNDTFPTIIEKIKNMYIYKLNTRSRYFNQCTMYITETFSKKKFLGLIKYNETSEKTIVETNIVNDILTVTINDSDIYQIVKDEFKNFGKIYENSLLEIIFIKNQWENLKPKEEHNNQKSGTKQI